MIGLRSNLLDFSEIKNPVKVIEINPLKLGLCFSKKHIDEVKRKLKGFDISIHSSTHRALTNTKYSFFNQTEINILKQEILITKYFKARYLNFHLKQGRLTKKQKEMVQEVIAFAKKNKVTLVFESNNYFKASDTLKILKDFPYLKYNLDIGHLNTSLYHKTFKMDLNKFLKAIKPKTICMHLHNNNGKIDQHLGLDQGTLDWKSILDHFNVKKLRFIFETSFEDYKTSKKILEQYIKKQK